MVLDDNHCIHALKKWKDLIKGIGRTQDRGKGGEILQTMVRKTPAKIGN